MAMKLKINYGLKESEVYLYKINGNVFAIGKKINAEEYERDGNGNKLSKSGIMNKMRLNAIPIFKDGKTYAGIVEYYKRIYGEDNVEVEKI